MTAKKKGRKRRKKAKDRKGVSIMLRRVRGVRGWWAKWIEPGTGKTVTKSLAVYDITTEEGAASWAESKAKKIAGKKRADIENGVHQAEPLTIEAGVKAFLDAKENEVKSATFSYYTDIVGKFERWAEGEGIKTTADLTPADLERYRDAVNAAKREAPRKNQKRGARRKTDEGLSPRRRNALLSGARMLLAKWDRLDLLPDATAAKAKDRLRSVPSVMGAPDFLPATDVAGLLRASIRHDQTTWRLTREEKARGSGGGTTVRYMPMAQFTAAMVLGGFRLSECRMLEWSEVDLAAGEIRLRGAKTKTKQDRTVTLAETPTLLALLRALKLRSGEDEFVFGGEAPLSEDVAKATAKRLTKTYGAPEGWNWLKLRRTCGSYLTCAPSIYGAASAFLSAKRLGHSVIVAEKHYAGAVSGISPEARTLEAALGIEDVMADVLATVKGVPAGAVRKEA